MVLQQKQSLVSWFNLRAQIIKIIIMVCLIPISKFDTSILQAWLHKVLLALHNLFVVVAVFADNHICNR